MTMRITKNLNLNMARHFEVFLNKYGIITKAGRCFRLTLVERIWQGRLRVNNLHTTTTAAGSSSEE